MAKNNREELLDLERQSVDTTRQMLGIQNQIVDAMNQRNVSESIFLEMEKKGRALSEDEKKAVIDTTLEHKKYVSSFQNQIRLQKQSLSLWERTKKITGAIYSGTEKYVYDYLMTADKAIKSIALEFGQAGGRADDMRISIEDSAIGAARLGMGVSELTSLYKDYVNQVGRTVTMNNEQMEAMAALAKGTGLANSEAALLAGQMELMGRDAVSVNKQVEGILETSERMGVNATKVLKAVSSNFKRLQTYTFRTGVQGMGDMAAYAEKFRIDIDTALSAAEKTRRLEGAVELAAKLQVLGGEFAKSDPFEMLFLSRNDPVQFQKKISELTRGMATLNKVGEEFEFQLTSPMAQDLLSNAGKALGISTEKMTEMAIQQAKLNRMRGEMFNAGYTKEQKEIVEGLAQMDSSTGKFFVNVKGARRDIADLTKTELSYLDKQSVSLKERAKNAQTFDDQFKIFMLELKAVGLPLLRGINSTLVTIRGWMDGFTNIFKDVKTSTEEWQTSIGKGIGFLLLGVPAIKLLLKAFTGMKALRAAKGGSSLLGSQALGAGRGAGAASKGAGLKALGVGAGIGLAGAGIGAGIMMSAKGIAELATSLSMLDKGQLETLQGITTTLAWFIGGAVAAAAGIAIFGTASTAASIGLIAFGGAVALIGGGIYLAATGIGEMAEGMGKLMKEASPTELLKLAGGMAGLATASALFINPASIAGMLGMTFAVGKIADYGDDLGKVGSAFANISTVLKGSKEDYAEVRATIDAIANADFSNLATLNNLNNLFNKPLQVEFADKEVGMVANITLEIDGEKFIENLGIYKKTGWKTKQLQNGGVS